MEPSISDDQFTPDFARSFNAALTNLIWIGLGVGLLYAVALVWYQQWVLAVLGVLSILIIPVAVYAKRQIGQGHIRTSLILFIAAIMLLLSSALVLVRGMDAAIVTGFSIPMLLSALLRTPRIGACIAIFTGGLYAAVILLAPVLPWQPVVLDPLLGTVLSLIITLTTLGILGLISWQIVSVLQRALGRAHMHLAAQQHAESALRESEAHVRSAFDYAAIGMALVALDGRWLEANQVLCDLVGYSESELRTINFQAITHPDDLATDEAYVQQMLLGSIRTYQMEKRYIHKHGQIVWVLLSVSLVRDAQDNPHYFIAQAQDIMARKHAESALRESEAHVRSAFDYAAIGMALVALDGRWLQVNQVLCNLVGYSELELRAIDFQTITHPDDLAADEAYVQQLLAGHIRTYQMEKRYIHKDGRMVWVLLSVSLVRDEQDNPHYFITQAQDIMARKNAEIELTHSYANNYALLEALPDTLYRFGANGTLQDYKAGYADALTIPSALFLGRHVSHVFPPAIADQITCAMTDVLATGQIQIVEQAILIEETLHDYEFRIVSSGINTSFVLVRDITDRKAIERLKDEFVATVSHELRTPLTAIHGALGLVSGGVAGVLPTQAHTMVEIALNNSDRLIRLINDLLDLQKIDADQFDIQRAPLALLPLLERTIATNAAYGQQFGVTFRLECAHTLVINTDADRLMQVLTNLLSNATKFSPAGDTVVVRVSRNQQHVRIAVIDHGPGIPAAFQSKLFHKFAQANGSNTRRSGGTGLGLSIAKKLIERLGGRIGFETTVGVGTTFYVELPAWHEADVHGLDQVGH